MEKSVYRFKDILSSDVWQYSNITGDKFSDNDYFLIQANRNYNTDYPVLKKSGLEYQANLSTCDITKGVESLDEIINFKIRLESKCDLGGHYNCGSAQVWCELMRHYAGNDLRPGDASTVNYTACTSTAYPENYIEQIINTGLPSIEDTKKAFNPEITDHYFYYKFMFNTIHESWVTGSDKNGTYYGYSYPWVYLYIDQLLFEINWKRKFSIFYNIAF